MQSRLVRGQPRPRPHDSRQLRERRLRGRVRSRRRCNPSRRRYNPKLSLVPFCSRIIRTAPLRPNPPETLLAPGHCDTLHPTAGGMGAGVSAAVIPLVPQPADDGRISGALSTPLSTLECSKSDGCLSTSRVAHASWCSVGFCVCIRAVSPSLRMRLCARACCVHLFARVCFVLELSLSAFTLSERPSHRRSHCACSGWSARHFVRRCSAGGTRGRARTPDRPRRLPPETVRRSTSTERRIALHRLGRLAKVRRWTGHRSSTVLPLLAYSVPSCGNY